MSPRRRLDAVLSLLGLLAACAPGGKAGVVLEFWAMGREGEVVQELMPEFERRYPGVRVEVQQIPWSAAHEKLLTAVVGESTPDVAQLGNTWVPEFVALDALENLDPWIRRSRAIDAGDFFSGIWDTNVIDERVYGVPWYVDTRLLFYRRDLLAAAGYAEPPRTWAEWLEAMRRVQRVKGGEGYAVLLETTDWRSPVMLGLEAGSPILREGGRYGAFNGPRFRAAFDFYLQLFREGLAPAVSGNAIPNPYQAFESGRIAMYLTGPWNIGEFRQRLPEALQDDWMTTPMPGSGDFPGVSVAGGASLVVFEASEHKALAWELVEYLAAPETQVRFYQMTGDLPSHREAWDSPVLAENEHARAFREQLQHVVSTPKVPEWEQIAALVMQYAEAAVLGRLTRDEALAALDRDVDRVLEKRRWLLEREAEREEIGLRVPARSR